MSEQKQLHFHMEQSPVFDLDVHDAAATRAWRKRCIEDEVHLTGSLPLRLVHVGVGVQRVGNFETALEPKLELQHAALFLATARQPDVVRSYREGEIIVEEADGKYRAVVALEFAHATGRWWTARRRVGTNQVSVGVFHGPWVEAEGEGIEALDEPLRDWIDTTGVEFGDARQQLTPKDEKPSVLIGHATLNKQPPPDPKVYAAIVGNMVDKQLMERYPTGFEIFAFRGLQVEHCILQGNLDLPIDDFVRAIAAQDTPADAVALRYPGVAEIDGEAHRAVVCAVECAGRRWDRVVVVKFGPEGKPVAARAIEQDLGPVPPEGLWLGVPPKNGEVTLFLMGPPGSEPHEA
jgi:hypothetical protein